MADQKAPDKQKQAPIITDKHRKFVADALADDRTYTAEEALQVLSKRLGRDLTLT